MRESITPIGTPVTVDVHKRRCKVVEFHDGEIKVRKPMANTREEWLEMLSDLTPLLRQASQATQRAAENIAQMPTRAGRASRRGDRALGHPDPGTVSFAMILGLMASWPQDNRSRVSPTRTGAQE